MEKHRKPPSPDEGLKGQDGIIRTRHIFKKSCEALLRLRARSGARKAGVPWLFVFDPRAVRTHIHPQHVEDSHCQERWGRCQRGARSREVALLQLLHDPSLASRSVVLPTVDAFFAFADFSLPLGDLEFAFQDLFRSGAGPT